MITARQCNGRALKFVHQGLQSGWYLGFPATQGQVCGACDNSEVMQPLIFRDEAEGSTVVCCLEHDLLQKCRLTQIDVV